MSDRDFQHYREVYESLPFEPTLERFRRKQISKRLAPLVSKNLPHILDVGVGRSAVSRHLEFPIASLALVEPMKWALDRDEQRFGSDHVTRFHGTYQSFISQASAKRKYDVVLFSGVLHEMNEDEAEQAVASTSSILAAGGLVLAVVPNRNSIHRVLGVHLGLQDSLDSRTQAEVRVSQQNGYTMSTLDGKFASHGFRSVLTETFFLKLSSHAEMAKAMESKVLTESGLDQLFALSELLPEHGAEVLGLYRLHSDESAR